MLLAGTLLALSLVGAGCKQGVGDRCEVASDCDSNYCVPGGGTANSICCDPNNLATCAGQMPGTGGSRGSGGAGEGGAGGAASDAAADASSTD